MGRIPTVQIQLDSLSRFSKMLWKRFGLCCALAVLTLVLSGVPEMGNIAKAALACNQTGSYSLATYGGTVSQTIANTIAGAVTYGGGNTLDCQLGTTGNDSAAQLNADNIFITAASPDVWKLYTRDEGATGSGLSGSLTLPANFWDLFEGELATIVLKDGTGIPDVYVAYLLVPGVLVYDWESPFYNFSIVSGEVVLGNQKEVSHVSVYVTPLPPAFILFGTVLLGFFGFRRWKARRSLAHA